MGNAQGAEHEIKMSARKGWHALDPNTARCLLVDRQNNAGDDGAHCEPLLIAYESIDSAIIAIDANDYIEASGLSGPSLAIASAHIRRVRDRLMEMAEAELDDEETRGGFAQPAVSIGSAQNDGPIYGSQRSGKTAAAIAVASLHAAMASGKLLIASTPQPTPWLDNYENRSWYRRPVTAALPPGHIVTSIDIPAMQNLIAAATRDNPGKAVAIALPPEIVTTTPAVPCPDCNGSKRYRSLLVDEPCRTCCGKDAQ
jgi:hypothetical protein